MNSCSCWFFISWPWIQPVFKVSWRWSWGNSCCLYCPITNKFLEWSWCQEFYRKAGEAH